MPNPKRKLAGLLDIGLIASLVGFVVVLINGDTMPGAVTFAVLLGLALIVTAIGVWREAAKERQLDEVQLAGASFGSRWGIAAVILVTLLATFMPPLQNLIEQAATAFEASDANPLSTPVRLFVMGLVCALLIDLSARSLGAAIWRRTKR